MRSFSLLECAEARLRLFGVTAPERREKEHSYKMKSSSSNTVFRDNSIEKSAAPSPVVSA